MFFRIPKSRQGSSAWDKVWCIPAPQYADIAFDNLADPKQLQVNIKKSKTDPFRVGRTGGDLYLMAAILS